MAKIEDLRGCFYPLTPKGISCLVGDLPWHYGTVYTNILYRADPEEVNQYLPEPLAPGPEPGICYMAFSQWWSLSGGQPDMAFTNPERTQYREAAIWAGCSYQGVPGQICLHIWVDKDFSLARGWFMGFPKKLGQIEITEYQPRNPRMQALGVGSQLKGYVASHGERLVEGALTIEKSIPREKLPYPMGSPIFHIRYFPSIVKEARPSVLELVRLGAENVNFGDDLWSGSGSLQFYPSDVEEHFPLRPREILGAYHYSSGYTFNGGQVLHSWV
jgi:acetoacetate decarboxylase